MLTSRVGGADDRASVGDVFAAVKRDRQYYLSDRTRVVYTLLFTYTGFRPNDGDKKRVLFTGFVPDGRRFKSPTFICSLQTDTPPVAAALERSPPHSSNLLLVIQTNVFK